MRKFFGSNRTIGLILTAALALGAGAAQAAPQALALVATNGEVDLRCEGSACSAEFTTFCLQPDRYSPARGTAYHAAEGGAITLHGTTLDGRRVSLASQGHLRFEALRSHVAMGVSIARADMERLGLHEVAVTVGENVTLLPTPGPDEAEFSEGEVAVLTQSLRPLGSRVIDVDPEHMVAARLTSRMINLLPPEGRDRAGTGAGLWQRTLAGTDAGLPAGGARMARRAYNFCSFAVNDLGHRSMRRCLQSHHDKFLDYLNSRYWDEVKTGS